MVFHVKVTDRIPSKYKDEVYDIYINWSEKLVKMSQMSLAIWLMSTKLGTTKPSEMLGREILFEKHSLTELPDYDPKKLGKDFEGEKYPRYYPVAFAPIKK